MIIMNKRKKSVMRPAALVALLLIACLVPVGAFAEETTYQPSEINYGSKDSTISDLPGPKIAKNRNDAAVINYLYLRNLKNNKIDSYVLSKESEFYAGKTNKGAGECYGYAERTRALFGSAGPHKSIKLKSTTKNIKKTLKKLRPGTHIRMGFNKNTGFHSICFLGITKDKVYFTDTAYSNRPIFMSESSIQEVQYDFYPYMLWYSEPKGRARSDKLKIAAKAFSGNQTVELAWLPVKGAKKYTVYRSNTKKGKYKKVRTSKNAWFVDRKSNAGMNYYKVKVIGKKKMTSKPIGVMRKLISPTCTVTYDNEGYPVITWNKVKGAKQYRVYVEYKPMKWKLLKATTQLKYRYTGATEKEEYIKVVSAKKAGSKANSDGTTMFLTRTLPAPEFKLDSKTSDAVQFTIKANMDFSWLQYNEAKLVLQRSYGNDDHYTDWDEVTLFSTKAGKTGFDTTKEFQIVDDTIDKKTKYAYRAVIKVYDKNGKLQLTGTPSKKIVI